MAKKNASGINIPKKIAGFKLSKGSRKDLHKLLKLIETPDARALALSAAAAAFTFLAERVAEREGTLGKIAGKAAALAKAH